MGGDVAPAVPFDPRARASYRAWVQIPIRFSDQDLLGHVNNNAIGVYFEHARCVHLLPPVRDSGVPGLDFVLARIVIDFVREIRYPGTVDVGTRIGRVGNRSLTLLGATFLGETCCAVSEATVVFFDTTTRRSTEPPQSIRAALAPLM